MDKIKVRIGKRDAKKADGYNDNQNCLMGTVLSRMFPNSQHYVWSFGFDIKFAGAKSAMSFYFPEGVDYKIRHAYRGDEYAPIDSKEFEPFTFTAIRAEVDNIL